MLIEEASPSILSISVKPSRQKSDEENELIRLREENTRLEGSIRSLSREIEELRSHKVANSEHPSYGELKLDLIQTKQDLNRAKEALAGIDIEPSRLSPVCNIVILSGKNVLIILFIRI